MRSHHDEFLHEIRSEDILFILKTGQWQAYNHEVSSALTNTNDHVVLDEQAIESIENTSGIDAYRDIAFDQHVKRVLDVGGGKYDCNRNHMRDKKKINLLVWDPFNRSSHHNTDVQNDVTQSRVDAAVSMSVLNVVPDIKSRLAHIATVWASLKNGGKAYFKIWPGEDLFRGTYLPIEAESYYQANAFSDRFNREIQVVFGDLNVRIDDCVPNLVVAIKANNRYLTVEQIESIQESSKNDMQVLSQIRQSSVEKLFKREYGLMKYSALFFKRFEDEMIEENRHQNAEFQKTYDKKFGLMMI